MVEVILKYQNRSSDCLHYISSWQNVELLAFSPAVRAKYYVNILYSWENSSSVAV